MSLKGTKIMPLVRITCVLLALLLFTAGIATAQEVTVGDLYSTEIIDCPDEITNGLAFNPPPGQLELWTKLEAGVEVEGETYECGIVVVPENYDEPDGHKLELFYVRLFSSSQAPAPDSVVYLAGGPGHSTSHEVSGNPGVLTNLNEIRERRDIIAYDQRGTGYSNYLLCAPFPAAFGLLLESSEDPAVIAGVEDVFNDVTVREGTLKKVCAAAYNAGDVVDLAQYNSVVSAQDIAALTEALGVEAYNLYGTSYGTRLAQFAMRGTPDRIRSVILDGVVSPSIPNTAVTFASYYEHYEQLFEQCAEDTACAAAYPNLPERFATLLAELEDNPFVIDPPFLLNPSITAQAGGLIPPVVTEINPTFFVAFAKVNAAYTNGGLAHTVPSIIQALEEGDTDYLRETLGQEPPENVTSGNEVQQNEGSDLQKFVAEQPLLQQPIDVLLSVAQVAAANANEGVDIYWVSVVLGDLQDRLLAGEDEVAIVSALLDWAIMPAAGTEAQALIDYANEHLSEDAAQLANGIVANMSRTDVRHTMWAVQDIANSMGTRPENRTASTTMQFAVNCAEDTSFSTIEDSAAYLEASPYPQLLVWPVEFNESIFAPCDTFPTPLDDSVTELVTADIPTLIFQEALDVNTPFSWGVVVDEALPNSYFVEWSNMGHIAIAHDTLNCAGDIAAAFVDNPELEPNSACSQTEAYKLDFVLPE